MLTLQAANADTVGTYGTEPVRYVPYLAFQFIPTYEHQSLRTYFGICNVRYPPTQYADLQSDVLTASARKIIKIGGVPTVR